MVMKVRVPLIFLIHLFLFAQVAYGLEAAAFIRYERNECRRIIYSSFHSFGFLAKHAGEAVGAVVLRQQFEANPVAVDATEDQKQRLFNWLSNIREIHQPVLRALQDDPGWSAY